VKSLNPLESDCYLPLRELSAYAGLSVRTLRGYLSHAAHPLPCYRVGGKVLVKRSEYDGWVAAFRSSEPGRVVDSIVAEVMGGL
jgi:hypothetical protein